MSGVTPYTTLHKSSSTSTMKFTKKSHPVKVNPFKLVPLEDATFDNDVINKWTELKGVCAPKRRTYHTACVHDDYLYIFGGKDISEGKLSDIGRIYLKDDALMWESAELSGDCQLEPLALHTGVEVNGLYYIIGGQNSNVNQVNSVYIYNFADNTISLLDIENNEFIPTEGHSCVYCEEKKCLIIFGGFAKGKETNDMYLFNIEEKNFSKVEVSEEEKENIPCPRSNHSAVMVDGKMYLFGGRRKEGVFLNDLWVYSPGDNKWQMLFKSEEKKPMVDEEEKKEEEKKEEEKKEEEKKEEEKKEEEKKEEEKKIMPKPRTRAAMCVLGKDIYIFGGKTGLIFETNDLWKYSIADNSFTKIHDCLLEQYSPEELMLITTHKTEDQKAIETKKNFVLLSRKQMEDRKNPLSKNYIGNKNAATKGMQRSMSTANLKPNYEELIFAHSGFHSIKHGPIYNLEADDVREAIEFLNANISARIGNKKERRCVGHVPLPRDGHTMIPYEDSLLVFGGDRNKYPFNDIFLFRP